MTKAYGTLQTMLESRFGVVPPSPVAVPASLLGNKPAEDGATSLFFQHAPQVNPAVLVVVLAMVVLMWRMALLDTLTMQILRHVAQRAAA